MRIGLFTDTYPPYINGVSTSVAMLKKALEKKGHQVYIVTVNDKVLNYKYEDDNTTIRIPGIPIGIYDYRLTGIYPLRAIEKIRKWNLDIIHSHTEFGIGTFARIIAKQLGIPLVHTYHTMYEDYVHYITKGYFNGPSKKIVEYLTKFYCDQTATELVVPTKKTYDLFKNKYKVDRNVHIVPTGIEIERFYEENYKKSEIRKLRESFGFKEDDFVILFVGRMGKEKNVDFLINAQKDLVKLSPNYKLLLIGDGPDLESYKKSVIKNKLSNNVIFAGRVPWEDVAKYYQITDVFATASTTETQGLTVIEAMAASKPVLAIDDESFRNVVIDELNGYIFRTRRTYIRDLEQLKNNPETYKVMKKQARISSELHSSKYFAEKILDVYKVALKDQKPGKKTYINLLMKEVKKGLYGK